MAKVKTWAVLQMNAINPETGKRGRWVMSLHASRAAAEARLSAFVQGVLDGSRESGAALALYLPAGASQVNLVPAMRVAGVDDTARVRTFYAGKLYRRKTSHMHSRRTA